MPDSNLYSGDLYRTDIYGVSEPNTPYGVMPLDTSMYVVPTIPIPAVRQPSMAQPSFPGQGVLRREAYPDNIYPLRQPAPSDSMAPVVGKQMSLEQLQQIQMKGESGGQKNPYQALNREKKGNTASGAYQVTDARWNNYGGYKSALLAPREVQDRWYREDGMRRLAKYGGDPFKMLADHYLPALANNPARWNEVMRFKNGTVEPVSVYLSKVVRGTQLEKPLQAYLQSHGLR